MATPEEPPLPPELSPRRQAAERAARGGGAGGRPGRGRGRRIWRIVWRTVAVLVVVVVLAGIATYFWADSRLDHVAAVSDYSGRPAQGKGTNWLLAGSDSRSKLTPQQAKEYHTGTAAAGSGGTDTILLLHEGSDGPVLVSLPRDSWVSIPAYTDSRGVQHPAQHGKINSAYNYGGPQLLVRTVEGATGLRVDHYGEIGFSGVVDVVDALGGVHICLPQAVHDSYSGANLAAGCQTLNGVQSLQLVRTRHAFANSDFARMQNQRRFMSALSNGMLTPRTLLDPFTLYPVMGAGLNALSVDKGSSLWTVIQMGLQVHGAKKQLTVPVADPNYTTGGGESAVLWDSAKAGTLFGELRDDRPVTVGSNAS